MASYIELFKSKMNWFNTLERTGEFPLDRSSMFDSYTDAAKYALGTGEDSRGLGKTAYVGQIITVYENGNVDVYKISADRVLESIGGTDTLFTDTYANALLLAAEGKVGQLIKIVSADGKGSVHNNQTYADGFYIIEAAGSSPIIKALSTSSGADDEIAALNAALTALSNTLVDVREDIYVTDENGNPTTELVFYTKAETDALLSSKTDASEHNALVSRVGTAETNISGITDTIATLATKTELTGVTGRVATIEQTLPNKADKTQLDSYYTKDEITGLDYATKTELNNAITAVPKYTISKSTDNGGVYSAVYRLYEGTTPVGEAINIPKDMVVSSGSVKYATAEDVANNLYEGVAIDEAYIELTLANSNNPVIIPAKSLIDIYTSGDSYIVIDNTTNKVTLDISTVNNYIKSNTLKDYSTTTEVEGKITTASNAAANDATNKANQALADAKSYTDTSLESYVTTDALEGKSYATTGRVDAVAQDLADTKTTYSQNFTNIANQLAGTTDSGLKTSITANATSIKNLEDTVGDSESGLVKNINDISSSVSELSNSVIKTVSLSNSSSDTTLVTKTGNVVTINVATDFNDGNSNKPVTLGVLKGAIEGVSNAISNKEIVNVVAALPEIAEGKTNVVYVLETEDGSNAEYVKLSADATKYYKLGSDQYAPKHVMASYTSVADGYTTPVSGLMTGADKYKLDSIAALSTEEINAVLI